MKVLLISANTERINILPLPLGLNSIFIATQNAEHKVKLLDLMAENDDLSSIREAITSLGPEIIGISVRNIDDQNMAEPRFLLDQVKKVVAECRKSSRVPIVLGGAGYSIFPQSALNYLGADMGIQGEGEMSFPYLLDRLERGEDISTTPGLYLPGSGLQGKRTFEKNLDRFPLPDAAHFSFRVSDKQELWIPLQTRRGCPMNCSYCSTATIEGRSIRKRRPDLIVEEIKGYVGAGFKLFYFVDNIFNIPPNYAKEICRKIIESKLDISWRCIVYPQNVDEELIGLMAQAGCLEVSLGFESGCEPMLRKMNKRYSPDEVRQTSAMFKNYGIKQMGFLLLGGPGETRESVRESLEFADSLNLDSLKITIGIRIYPQTALAQTAIDEGLILPGDDLLFPRFYVVPGLKDWLYDTVCRQIAKRQNWTF
jgi:radical SAM superfamily enzyme YgiQ (UPF0313 family)